MSLSRYSGVFIYLLPILLLAFFHVRKRNRDTAEALEAQQEAMEAGLTEPSSLHPLIDVSKCLGAGGCVHACPEGAIGLIGGKAYLVDPSHCIGHGACEPACPHKAIKLVFGTEKRGMDIPKVNPNFETNVPGIFIAGELGGMGLIRKSALQGSQAMESIRKLKGGNHDYDVVIVGAGPAGMGATLGAIENDVKYVTLEQEESLGGAIFQYPRNKIAMTAPVKLPVVGEIHFKEVSKEALLEFWEEVVDDAGIKINLNERMETITKNGDGFLVKTSKQTYDTRAVLLSIGRRGTPRKLGVPGEDLPKVVYRLIDPEQYRRMHVLVVGGGDSALEAACSIADEPGTTVTLSYRSEAFGRSKQKNRDRLANLEARGKVKVLLKSAVKDVSNDRVSIEYNGEILDIPNQAIIVCAGGILPTPFLKQLGILVETKFGTE
jgi:thioredoxin reductase (NADPH)